MNRSVVWMLCAGVAGTAPLASATDACAARAADILAALRQGDYAAATAHFDARMQAALDARRLGQVWASLPQQLGAFDRAGDVQVRAHDGASVAELPLHFANGWLLMRVACDADGRVGSLFFAPWTPPSDAPPALPGERRLDVPSPLGPLTGALVVPRGEGPFPAVVLVAGSGAHDRDETIGPNRPLRDLAEGLAAAGIASLRYDKRTFAYGARMAGQPVTIDDEVTDDALAAVRLLAKQPGIDPRRVFVLGHSLGAMLAPRIGQRDPQLAGLVLLAAPARPLLVVSAQQVREQGRRAGATEAQIAADEQAIEAERKLLAKARPGQPPAGTFARMPQSYWFSLRDYDQVAVAKDLPMPLLVLQGGADFQVSPEADFARWKQAMAGRAGTAFHLYPGLSHLFMPAGASGTVKDYQAPGHVDAQVIRDVAAWIAARPAR